MKTLEPPACRYGYTDEQVERIVGDQIDAFNHWMAGQTLAVCDGTGRCRKAHGTITYQIDLLRFLDGHTPLD
jgi:hypothetical protein